MWLGCHAAQAGLPFLCLIATSKDEYRKPETGCWRLVEALNGDIAVDRKASFFVGDSAGRSTDRKGGSADKDFAAAAQLPFFTETQYFLGTAE